MWNQFNRIVKEGGAIVLTSAQPFTTFLINSNIKNFKYDLIWSKTLGSGQLNINTQPLRIHETILVFSNGSKIATYNEIFGNGNVYSVNRNVNNNNGYGEQKNLKIVNNGSRRAKSVINVSNPRITGGHPTQKPVELMEYLVKTYSNTGDTILDCFMGSCTTGIACRSLNRNFIGIENDEEYFQKAKNRLDNFNPLRELRLSLDMNKSDFARFLNCNYKTYTRYESNIVETPNTMKLIIRLLKFIISKNLLEDFKNS